MVTRTVPGASASSSRLAPARNSNSKMANTVGDRTKMRRIAKLHVQISGIQMRNMCYERIVSMEVDEDVSTKWPRMSESSKEIVDIEDDDDRSINKGKATIVEEESQEQSQSVFNTEKTIINPTIVEISQASAMILQSFTLNEVETSQVSSQEELIKDFTDERNKSANDNYKLMQQIRRVVPGKRSLLAVREA